MARTGLKHWMLHNDQLASELDETLKLSPGYDPVRDADPALTFHAPLLTGPDSIPGAIRATVERNSDATYKAPRGAFLLSALDDESRHEYTADDEPLGALMEPAITNKCENYNASPDELLTNIIVGGDPAGIVSVVDDIEELRAAGLDRICPGQAIKVDNSAGSSLFYVQVAGESGNVNAHSIQAYARNPVGTCFLEISGGGGPAIEVISSNYQLYQVSGMPPFATGKFQFSAFENAIGYFILNKLEESEVPSSVIITEGAATSRAVDQLSWLLAGQPYQSDVVINGQFDTDTGWTKETGWSIGSGLATFDGQNIDSRIYQGTLTIGDFYELSYHVVSIERGKVNPRDGGAINIGDGAETVGPQVERFRATTTTLSFNASIGSDAQRFKGSIDNVVCRKLTPILNQSEGMAALIWRPSFGDADIQGAGFANIRLLRLGTDASQLLYFQKDLSTGQNRFFTWEGATYTSVFLDGGLIANLPYVIAVRWVGSIKQIGFKAQGAWTWSSEDPFDGYWENDGVLNLVFFTGTLDYPSHAQHVHLWSSERGRDWLERYFKDFAQ